MNAKLLGGLMGGLFSLSALAAPVAPKDLNWLSNVSSAVVVGTAETASYSSGSLAFAVRVTRGVHGAAVPGSLLAATWPGAPAGSAATAVGVYGLWFLGGDEVSGWTLLPAADGAATLGDAVLAVPAGALLPEYAYAAGDPVVDKVISELRAATAGSDDDIAGGAFASLLTLTSPPSQTGARHAELYGVTHFTDCPTGRVLATWDSSLVTRAANLAAQSLPVPEKLAGNLCLVADPTTVAGLAQVLAKKSSGGTARACAAKALGNVHSAEALPHMRGLLDWADPAMQYAGLSGLALNANAFLPGRDPRDGPRSGGAGTAATLANFPSEDAFRADPAPYLAFWRNWYPNVAPTVSVSGGGATCHPPAPWKPCTLPVSATGSDTNGDPLYFKWNACTPALEADTSCNVSALGANTLTVTASDGRGGTAQASLVLYGVNQTPTMSQFHWTPNHVLSLDEDATLAFEVSDDDVYPDWASCRVMRVFRNCQLVDSGCDATGGWVDVHVHATGGSYLCTVEIEWTDKWGARLVEQMSADTQ
jgi:hypothetical protein